jgi:hypothetical protein
LNGGKKVIGKMQKCSKISHQREEEYARAGRRERKNKNTKAEQNFSGCAREEHASRDERERVCLPF